MLFIGERVSGKSVQRPRSRTATKAEKPSALDGALMYATLGIPVIWIPSRSKAPIVKGWPQVATTDSDVIRQWAVEHFGCNFGLVMGNGFVAIDIDHPERLPELKALRFELPPTRLHKTSRGLHFLYKVPRDVTITSNTKRFNGIVDIRHTNTQIVGPGSVHESGALYQIEVDLPIADLPEESLRMLMKPEPAAQCSATATSGAIPEGQRNTHLTSLAGSMRRRDMGEAAMLAALRAENAERCVPPLDDREIQAIARSISKKPPDEGIQAMLNDERPKVMLPGEDRLMSDVGAELGEHLADKLYEHTGEVAIVREGMLVPVSAQTFRTLVETYVVCCKISSIRSGALKVGKTMTVEDARGIMAADSFRSQLRPLSRVNRCRLPVLRSDGRIELLPEGYDAETQALTIRDVVYDENMHFDDAVNVMRDLFGEFVFADEERSRAVAIAALVGLYGAQLLPKGELRPSFIYTKNAEGAGATTCASCAVLPILGKVELGAMPDDEPEMRKQLTAAVREARQVVMFDNVKRRIDFAALEAFITSDVWRDRLLGVNESVVGPNTATVFITANGATVSPDMRRRSLFVELHLREERAEDRQFIREINDDVLRAMRPKILAACWALVRNWDDIGRPRPRRSHSAFPAWASVVGGIVQAAGFGCALDTAEVSAAADEDGAAMRTLTKSMKMTEAYTSKGLADLCRRLGVFPHLVGDSEAEMSPKLRSAFGKMLGRYNDRLIGGLRFLIEGEGHGRRYRVMLVGDDQQGRKVEQGVSPRAAKKYKKSPRVKDLARPCDLATPASHKWKGWRQKTESQHGTA
jgi:Bifunctional DNA primase/polymerase, N-terminal/Primase C terminal 1 (PriCT-1)